MFAVYICTHINSTVYTVIKNSAKKTLCYEKHLRRECFASTFVKRIRLENNFCVLHIVGDGDFIANNCFFVYSWFGYSEIMSKSLCCIDKCLTKSSSIKVKDIIYYL